LSAQVVNFRVPRPVQFSRAVDSLVRPQEGRVLAGVIAGLGRRVGLDPWPARLLFVLILLILPGSQLLIYPVLWILMPNEAPAAQFVAVTEEKETASAA
jgi:phage shock protein PspC (stress-responsive transcriptional regulator)